MVTPSDRFSAATKVDDRLARLERDAPCGGLPAQNDMTSGIQAAFLRATQGHHLTCENPVCNNSLTSQREIRVLRTQTGRSQLAELAKDTFFQITCRMHPLDLLRLSRTSKCFRDALLSKNSRVTWKASLSAIPNLPPCPSDVSEPFYAALVFDRCCFGCGADEAFSVDYALRVRMCEDCYSKNVVEGTELLKAIPEDDRGAVQDIILMLIPSANIFNYEAGGVCVDRASPLSHLPQDSYFKPDLEAVLNVFWPLPPRKDFEQLKGLVRKRINEVMRRQAPQPQADTWDNIVGAEANDLENALKVQARLKTAFQNEKNAQIVAPAWGSDVVQSDPAFAGYVANTSPPEPSPHPTSEPPKTPAQIAAETTLRVDREARAHVSRLRARRAEVASWYLDLVEDHCEAWDHDRLPNAYDGGMMWGADWIEEDDARAPLDYEDYQLESMWESLKEYEGNVLRMLEQMLPPDSEPPKKSKGKSKRERMRRPTALFKCEMCGVYPYAWLGINVHWREEHGYESIWEVESRGLHREGFVKAKFWSEGTETVERLMSVLVEVGLTKWERDLETLDGMVAQGRVYCACGDPEMGALMSKDEGEGGRREKYLTWAKLVRHIHEHLEENIRRPCIKPESDNKDAPVWINDHDLASCVKFLPEGADTSCAAKRVRADPYTRARINAHLAQCPEGLLPVCGICEGLMPVDRRDATLIMKESADKVVYHMQAKHGRRFQEKDIVFRERSAFPDMILD